MTTRNEAAIEQTEDAIEATRERVRHHIDALQSDLSPANIMNQLMPAGQGVGETIQDVADAARRNPLATALIAGGALLLGKEVLNSRDPYYAARRRAQAEDAAARVGQGLGELKQRAENTAKQVKSTGNQAVATASEAISGTTAKSSELAQDAYEQARHKINRAGNNIVAAGSTGRRWVEQNPLATGLACAAAGALVASFFTAKPLNEVHNDPAPSKPKRSKPRKAATTKRTTATKSTRKAASKPQPRKTAKTATSSVKTTPSVEKPTPSPTPNTAAAAVKSRAAYGSVDSVSDVRSKLDNATSSPSSSQS